MPNERQMWQALQPHMSRLHLDPVRVENPAMPGTPDVNYKEGWLELKHTDRWPVRGGPIQLPHPPTPEQRAWLYRRWMAGGVCFLLIRVGQEWLLIEGFKPYALWKQELTREFQLKAAALRVFESPREVATFLSEYERQV